MRFPISEKSKQKHKRIRKAAILLIVALSIVFIVSDQMEREANYLPDYEKETLDAIFEDGTISDKEYEILFKQTGLGKPAVDYILSNEEDYILKIKQFQHIFFNGYSYTCDKIGIVTYEEKCINNQGKLVKAYPLVDVQPGDILITFSTHTLGYRHGHCGIVVDTKENKTVEAIILGQPSSYQTLSKWETYPTLLHLRISKKAAREKGYQQKELGQLAAEYAQSKGMDIYYGLLSGFFDNNNGEVIKKTHCSHLIWYVFYAYGYDLNSDGGKIVTPMDIAQSDLLEIVQMYGINLSKINGGNFTWQDF